MKLRVGRAVDSGPVPNRAVEFDGQDVPTVTVHDAPTTTAAITIPDPPPPEMLDDRGRLAPVHCHRDTVEVTTAGSGYAGEWLCIVCGARLVQPFKHEQREGT